MKTKGNREGVQKCMKAKKDIVQKKFTCKTEKGDLPSDFGSSGKSFLGDFFGESGLLTIKKTKKIVKCHQNLLLFGCRFCGSFNRTSSFEFLSSLFVHFTELKLEGNKFSLHETI